MKALPRSNSWLFAWWLVLLGLLVQQVALHKWRGGWLDDNPSFSRVTYLVVLTPLIVSVMCRWLLWPRMKSVGASFAVFLSGVILAAMSALQVTFLDVPDKGLTFLICLGGILEFAPIRKKEPNQSLQPTRSARG